MGSEGLKLQIGATLRKLRQKPPANANPWTKAWPAWLESSAQLSPNARHIRSRRLNSGTGFGPGYLGRAGRIGAMSFCSSSAVGGLTPAALAMASMIFGASTATLG